VSNLLSKLSQFKRWPTAVGVAALLVSLALPLLIDNDYVVRVCTIVWLYGVLCMSLNFIMGFGGMLSFGHHAFYGIGAYATAMLMTRHGFGFAPAMLCATALTFGFALVVGIPVTRVRGDYLVLITMAFAEIFRLVMQGWQNFTNGQMGIVGVPSPSMLGMSIESNTQFYYLAFVMMLLTLGILTVLARSKFGRALIAIREDELAARTNGINTGLYRLLAFAIGCMFAGFAGSFLAVYLTTVAPSNFTLNEGVLMIVMAIVGGLGSLPGSILGAGVLLFATELFRGVYRYRLLIIGLIMVVVLLRHPQGIMGIAAYRRANGKKGGR
jgi:branched-chain amino acid transport system permease protein